MGSHAGARKADDVLGHSNLVPTLRVGMHTDPPVKIDMGSHAERGNQSEHLSTPGITVRPELVEGSIP